jgi:hypothetical protein
MAVTGLGDYLIRGKLIVRDRPYADELGHNIIFSKKDVQEIVTAIFLSQLLPVDH